MNIRPLSAYDAAALGVATRAEHAAKAVQRGIKGQTSIGDVNAPAVEITETFTFQSYFDSTLLETAILPQPQNEPIIPSTLSDPAQISGYGIALHPSSEAPIACSFDTGAQQGRSMTYKLSPGQVLRPFGRPDGLGVPGSFSGFRFGLPFGWLGGGNVKIIILRTPDAHVYWNGFPEIIFQRQRMEIIDPAAFPGTIPLNWPKRFPWVNAIGATGLRQSGTGDLAVTPTRTSLSLRVATLANPVDVRLAFMGTQDFGQLSDGSIDTSDGRFVDMTWGSYTQAGPALYPTQVLTGESALFGADDGGLVMLDLSAGGDLVGEFVDVVRYGRL